LPLRSGIDLSLGLEEAFGDEDIYFLIKDIFLMLPPYKLSTVLTALVTAISSNGKRMMILG
jgi:hypothetical protein